MSAGGPFNSHVFKNVCLNVHIFKKSCLERNAIEKCLFEYKNKPNNQIEFRK